MNTQMQLPVMMNQSAQGSYGSLQTAPTPLMNLNDVENNSSRLAGDFEPSPPPKLQQQPEKEAFCNFWGGGGERKGPVLLYNGIGPQLG